MADPFNQPITFGGEISAAPHNDAWDELEDWLNDRFGSLTSAMIPIANASGKLVGIVITGDGTISNAGVFAIGNNKITRAMLQDGIVGIDEIDPALIGPLAGTLPYCELTNTGASTINSGAGATLNFDTEVADTDGMHSGSGNLMTVQTAGVYAITGYVVFTQTLSDQEEYKGFIEKNGVIVAGYSAYAADNNVLPRFTVSTVIKCAAADTLQLFVGHDHASSRTVGGGATGIRFAAHLLGTG